MNDGYQMARAEKTEDTSNVVPLKRRPLENETLISGVLAGDRIAAAQFHDRYGERVNRWVWRLLGADRDHEDVVQQVFIGILSSIGKIKNAAALDSWVDSVTIRTVRKEIRKRTIKRTLFIAASSVEMDNARDRKSAFKQAHIQSFYKVLQKMPADDRIIFVLRHLEGQSLEEIALFGNYSLSTAKRRLKRAKSTFSKRAAKDFVLMSMLEDMRHET
jgi:RNA polymerase sigma-70 factor (ECF subfamily)